MSTSSESAEELIRLYLEGAEFALKITGSATKNIVAALYVMSKDQKTSKGKTRLANMLRSDKELKIFSIKEEEMKIFAKQAKTYGVLYCALVNHSNEKVDNMVDIMVRADDAPKVNRIVQRFKLTTVDKGQVVQDEIEKGMQDKKTLKGVPDIDVPDKNVDDEMLDDILSNPVEKEADMLPLVEQTMKENQLESSLESKNISLDGMTKSVEKKSVRKQLEEFKKEEKIENTNNEKLNEFKLVDNPANKVERRKKIEENYVEIPQKSNEFKIVRKSNNRKKGINK